MSPLTLLLLRINIIAHHYLHLSTHQHGIWNLSFAFFKLHFKIISINIFYNNWDTNYCRHIGYPLIYSVHSDHYMMILPQKTCIARDADVIRQEQTIFKYILHNLSSVTIPVHESYNWYIWYESVLGHYIPLIAQIHTVITYQGLSIKFYHNPLNHMILRPIYPSNRLWFIILRGSLCGEFN